MINQSQPLLCRKYSKQIKTRIILFLKKSRDGKYLGIGTGDGYAKIFDLNKTK
jgi:hypothetical protein